jgi:hypothetical protein
MTIERKQYSILTWKYEALLVSLLLLLFGNLFVPESIEETAQAVYIILTIVVGLAIFEFSKTWRRIIISMLISICVLEVLHLFDIVNLRPLLASIYIIYFVILSVKLYHVIYKSKTDEKDLIVAAFCGFIMLGFLASFVFVILESVQPGSFTNIEATGKVRYQNIQYFSFITTLTIGYGDIVPSSELAKKVTVLFGLMGNFYSVFVIGIIIGKYLNKK